MTDDGVAVTRQRQAAALATAEKYSGRTKTWLAANLHLSYDQYGRYVSTLGASWYGSVARYFCPSLAS